MNAVEAVNSITLANVYKSKVGGVQGDIVAFNDVPVPSGKSIKVHIASSVPTYADQSHADKIKLLLPLSGVVIHELGPSSYLINTGPYNLFGVVVRTGDFSLTAPALKTIKLTWPAPVDSLWDDTYGLILTPDNKICVLWDHWCLWKQPQSLPKNINEPPRFMSKVDRLVGKCHIDLAGRVDIEAANLRPG